MLQGMFNWFISDLLGEIRDGKDGDDGSKGSGAGNAEQSNGGLHYYFLNSNANANNRYNYA